MKNTKKTKPNTCHACPYPLPEDPDRYLISFRNRKGETSYKRLCKECYEIYWIVKEREYQKK